MKPTITATIQRGRYFMKTNAFDLHVGDCLESLRKMPDQSVHCCVTSPPYFGLRDYGVDGQIGLEETPAEFIARLVEVFREVRRVLRDDGTAWVNMGDSYAGSWGAEGRTTSHGNAGHNASAMQRNSIMNHPKSSRKTTSDPKGYGLKPKDMMGIPWRLAFALQDDGWFLRQDIIWHKPNPMPESVTDRCTKSHEYVFLLSKARRYYFDHVAIKEPAVYAGTNNGVGFGHGMDKADRGRERVTGTRSQENSFKREGSKREQAIPGQSVGTHRPDREESTYDIETRNRRSVWNIATRPFKGAHFATFPPALIEPCILAGCPIGGVVLDPFGGSGTTAGVALAHDRKAVICELNPEYAELMPSRIGSILESYRKTPKVKRKPKVASDKQGALFDGAHC